ncbi:MAG: glycosyltransferase family 87 protein [Actinomycetota bacterium]|nr:glycosyltransferase family 87 protein [Actinomycetota bacterium]
MSTTPGIALEHTAERSGRRRHLDAVCNVLAGPIAILWVLYLVVANLRAANPAFDFQHAYWHAGHRVLLGQSPYLWTAAQFREKLAFVYPALSAVMFAPLSLIPRSTGAVLFTFVSVALLPLTLWVLRVRDWRVYGIAALWQPFYDGWMTANESIYLMFGLACVWRVRDRSWMAGLLTAVLISLKPLLWPLGLWLLATRRWRASLYTLAWAVVLNLVAWGIVGFGQIGAYLHASAVSTADAWRGGFGLPAFLGRLGLDWHSGLVVLLVVSAVVVAALIRSGRHGHGDHYALVLMVALALVSSPQLSAHYMLLLLVPLALLRPRLDWLWAVPVLLWVSLPTEPVSGWQQVCAWVLVGGSCLALVRQTARPTTLEPAL